MGYAGGTKDHPTYRSMGDHTECFQVDFDPDEVGYEELLDAFWTSHDPTRPAWKMQYASLVLAHSAEQLQAARESAERFSATVGRPVATRIGMLGSFWRAEDYHQKYYLRNDRVLARELREIYPVEQAFVESAAAARLNGYLYGAESCARLERDLPLLGLSPQGATHLRTRCR